MLSFLSSCASFRVLVPKNLFLSVPRRLGFMAPSPVRRVSLREDTAGRGGIFLFRFHVLRQFLYPMIIVLIFFFFAEPNSLGRRTYAILSIRAGIVSDIQRSIVIEDKRQDDTFCSKPRYCKPHPAQNYTSILF